MPVIDQYIGTATVTIANGATTSANVSLGIAMLVERQGAA